MSLCNPEIPIELAGDNPPEQLKMSRSSRKTRTPMSRRQQRILTAATAVVMMGLFAMSRLGVFKTNPVGDRRLYNDQTFTVVKVVDGDTLDLNIADHKADRKHTRVRLWGVDTPETKHPRFGEMYWGPQAAKFAREKTLHQRVRVILEPDEKNRGKFGRLLAYIYLPDGKMLNEELIKLGHGYADPRFRHMLRKKFLQLQKEAQKEQYGLWKDVRPDQWPPWYRKRNDPEHLQ
jgi:micrococcal nuclease